MRLSELKELRPDVWEIAKQECILLSGDEDWEWCVKKDFPITGIFSWEATSQKSNVWFKISSFEDFSLMDKWIAENEHTV